MSSAPILTIHSEKKSEFEFDVMIRGLNETVEPEVRFVIEDINGHNVSINCIRTPTKRWLVKVPAISIAENQRNFRVEVITEGYYFTPTSGTLKVERTPQVTATDSFRPLTTEPSRPMVEAVIENKPTAAVNRVGTINVKNYTAMTPAEQKKFIAQCGTAGSVFLRAGDVLRTVVESEDKRRELSSRNLAKLLRIVEGSIKSVRGLIGDE